VVINTLNRHRHLERALAGLREQTVRPFEVIVVNGPSDDDTGQLLDSLKGRVRALSCPEASLGRSRNIGVDAAGGEIVAFVDDDAVPAPSWLAQLLSAYRSRRVAAAGGPVFDVPKNQAVWRLCTCTRLGAVDTSGQLQSRHQWKPGADPFGYLPGCNMSFRRAVIAEIGGFDEQLSSTYDDSEICSRVIDQGHRVRVLSDVLVRHERERNQLRDEEQRIHDPYPILFDRAVFASHVRRPERCGDSVAWALERATEEMIDLAGHYVAEERLSEADHLRFAARARNGAADGLRAGSRPRLERRFSEPDQSAFTPYL
jgi:GT2 family glycosyltransferase